MDPVTHTFRLVIQLLDTFAFITVTLVIKRSWNWVHNKILYCDDRKKIIFGNILNETFAKYSVVALWSNSLQRCFYFNNTLLNDLVLGDMPAWRNLVSSVLRP